jgi:hypothetical protein
MLVEMRDAGHTISNQYMSIICRRITNGHWKNAALRPLAGNVHLIVTRMKTAKEIFNAPMHTRRNSMQRDITSEQPTVVTLVKGTMKFASILPFLLLLASSSV